ncbi:MAG TPA: hypothetical protein VHC86_00450 [Opitutaceae bacterium]|nr:hypothetical protein [Opitutaceae bacterium]
MTERRPLAFTLGVLLWAASLLTAFGALTRYGNRPGAAGKPLRPSEPASLLGAYRREGRPLLVMVVHPRCPCTDASLDEMGELLARAQGACDAVLVRYQAAGWPAPPRSQTLAGRRVPVLSDPEGRLAVRLGAETSGHCLLIDAQGQVRFEGGITPSRGHRGSAPGQDAILAVLHGEGAGVAAAPVFGCSLANACLRPPPT